MHNAAFEVHKLPFHYALCTQPTYKNIVARMQTAQDTGFAGGSITIPLKVDILHHLDFISPAAQAIGAVNIADTSRPQLELQARSGRVTTRDCWAFFDRSNAVCAIECRTVHLWLL
ncbi:hypothetical protein PINS_up023547 [Pythium insidiosum]|nr:hypothetical protein PINS_up023547 [Pythium insidiosum]